MAFRETPVFIPVDFMQEFLQESFAQVGCSLEESERVTWRLIGANLRGHESHGVARMPRYVEWVQKGTLIPNQKIRLIQGDTDAVTYGRGTYGSRSMTIGGSALKNAADKIIEKAKKIAAHVLEAAEEDIEFSEGNLTVAGTDKSVGIMTIAEKARELGDTDELPESLSHTVNHKTAPISFPNGCHVAEVEVDPDTGVIRIERYTVVDDFGVVVNPMIVEGQVHGGIAQGIGQVMGEDTIYDDDGQLMTATFVDYQLPRADDIAHIDFTTHAVPCKTNPLGVKGCGEAGNGGSYPVIYNAIMDALDGNGGKEIGIPTTPPKVWKALNAG